MPDTESNWFCHTSLAPDAYPHTSCLRASHGGSRAYWSVFALHLWTSVLLASNNQLTHLKDQRDVSACQALLPGFLW